MNFPVSDGSGLIAGDQWLAPFAGPLAARQAHFREALNRLKPTGGLLGQISQGHHYFGFNRGEFYGKPGVWYREWAPAALQLRLIGDFNNWDRWGNPMVRDQFGVWSLFLPDDKFGDKLVHGSKVKVHVVGEDSKGDGSHPRVHPPGGAGAGSPATSSGIYWNPPEPYAFQQSASPNGRAACAFTKRTSAWRSEEAKVGTFDEFTDNVLPRIAHAGLQRHAADGGAGASVLRLVRLSRQQLLRRLSRASARRRN